LHSSDKVDVSIIAGAVSRKGRKLPGPLRDRLIQSLSRHSGDSPEMASSDDWILAKVDVGAYRCRAFFAEPAGPAFVMAGEALFTGSFGKYRNREEESIALLQALDHDRLAALQASTGAFCGALYSPERRRLTLFADKLGVRPITIRLPTNMRYSRRRYEY